MKLSNKMRNLDQRLVALVEVEPLAEGDQVEEANQRHKINSKNICKITQKNK